tara:strand:+ start:64 stop:1278 length:1215 start_codon:yes stop_codon:yes gene_type:complete
MALLEHQYSQARYYGGTYSFTGDDNNTLAEYTITLNYNDIQPDPSDPNLALSGSYKVYIDNVFVSPTYIDATNTSNNNYLIKFDNTTPTSKGWYIAWDATGPNDGQTFTIVFNQNDPNTRLGSYQFMPLSEIINNFMFTHVGEDKLIPRAQRTDVAFHAQRALAELSFDTFKSCKSQEITIPPYLTMSLPHDYVNYVKLTTVDSAGIEHVLYPTIKTSNPRAIKQESDGTYSNDTNADNIADSDNLIYDENSTAWNSYKTHEPSENNSNDYQDYQNDIYWPNEGRRFGLDPQHAQVNGSYYIDCHAGKIHFSSNLSGKTVILKYISDSLGTDHEMQVHKLAEEALYKWIMYGLLSTRRNIPEYVIQRYKKERFAETRKAKLRLSNIKLEEITQIFRGKSKQIKH